MSEAPDTAAELRRLRAALAVSAELIADRDPLALAQEELELISAICRARGDDAPLRELWRDLRHRSTALAADLPAEPSSLALLREQLAKERG